ncbi:hypothetical protein [Flavobacterium branchiicola]|uniref:Carboxypeptidase-like protein n=1 Tax=Flavobacterium branchiicola TaxID=1114875 RepID=A0ABV9P852_9FLAO|nr:hypothetical protein [Flavobacterium branchiicola]MBS7252378.1 hypothetical protein [Flavobacterium branchiicola]
MKKKFTLEITNPCSENFDKMIPNSNGSFCNSCMKNVIDLSKKSNSEVARFIAETKDKNICARIKSTQLQEEFEYNEISKINNLKYAAVAASILLASNVSGQEKTPVKTEINSPKPNNHIVGKVAYNQNIEQEVSILIKGKLLDANTNRPLDNNRFPNLVFTINGSQSASKINHKTGEFSIPVTILKNTKTLTITIEGDDHYYSQTIPFDITKVQNNTLMQNIVVPSEEFSKVKIMMQGGLGINYIDKKEVRQI